MKDFLTQKQQDYNTKRCTYCNGTGRDLFDKDEPCPNCIKTVLVDDEDDIETHDNYEHYMDYKNQEIRELIS